MLLLPLVLMTFMSMIGVTPFTVIVLMIVSVGHRLAAAITLSFTAERRLRVLALSVPAGDSLASRSVAATAFDGAVVGG